MPDSKATESPSEPVITVPPGTVMPEEAGVEGDDGQNTIEQPAKLLRIAVMIRELLEEVRREPLDEHAREHLRDIHAKVIAELKTGLSGALAEELERITLPLPETGVPTDSEIRIAQAQLLGWLEGLFQGIQAALATQQMAAQAQLMEMRRRGLPPGLAPPSPQQGEGPPGQYL
ncbi:MAG TPA: proteasome activator [Actinomycetota bacterium]|nr:proteasome activator [Actinomycetota bacterium]